MATDIRLARIQSIDLWIQAPVLVVFGLLVLLDLVIFFLIQRVYAISGLALCLSLVIVLHEFGHALCARRYFIHTRGVRMTLYGGQALLLHLPAMRRQRVNVLMAGPAVNGVLLVAVGMTRYWMSGFVGASGAGFVDHLLLLLLIVTLGSIVPIPPSDGWRVLREYRSERRT